MPDRPLLAGFRRASVADQAAAALRDAIRRGALGDRLPGELTLAREFGISRPSLRTALAQLRKEGLILTCKGRRSRLSAGHRRRLPGARPAVGVICPLSHGTSSLAEHPVLLELHAQLATHGIAWEEISDARLAGARPGPRLGQIVQSRPGVCWVLLASTAPMQHWFAHAGRPALVLGSCHPGAALPSVDLDYRAVGWHAAGSLVRQGHTRIGLVMPDPLLAGDLACRDGFMDYVAQRAVTTIEIKVTGGIRTLRPKLDRLLASGRLPTALLSMHPAYSLALLMHVLGAGLRIPRDLSLIARDTHPLLDTALPELTRYSGSSLGLATKAMRMAEALLAGKPVPPKPVLIPPRFIAGATLGRPAA